MLQIRSLSKFLSYFSLLLICSLGFLKTANAIFLGGGLPTPLPPPPPLQPTNPPPPVYFPSSFGGTDWPQINNTALSYPLLTTSVYVTVVCFDANTCPKNYHDQADLTASYLSYVLNYTNQDFVSNGIPYLRLSLAGTRKVIDPALYSGDPASFSTVTQYFVPGYLNIVISKALPGVSEAALVDQTLRGAGQKPLIIMTASFTPKPGIVPNLVLSHGIAHVVGSDHVADWGGGRTYRYTHSECSSDFQYQVLNANLTENQNFIRDSYYNVVACNNKVAHLMNYGAWSPTLFAPGVSGCTEPTLFTDSWYMNSKTTGGVANNINYYPATYGNAERVIFKCWNYRNR